MLRVPPGIPWILAGPVLDFRFVCQALVLESQEILMFAASVALPVGLSDCRKFGQLQLKAASIGVLGIQSPSFVVLTVLALTDLKLQL